MEASIIYGYNPVYEALLGQVVIDAIYLAVGLSAQTRDEIVKLARERNIKVLKTDRLQLDKMAGGGVHQGVVAVSRMPGYRSLEQVAAIEGKPRTIVLCLDGVQDPHNLGALARSARAFGATGMVIPARRAAGVTPAAMKASAGALTVLPVAQVQNLRRAIDRLKDLGFWVCGAVMDGDQLPWQIDPGEKVALVLGGEGGGVRDLVDSALDFRVRIPMAPGAESLNVSVTGALLLYEWLARPKSDSRSGR